MEILTEDDKCRVIYTKDDIYSDALKYTELDIKTYYEKQHLEDGRKIKYIKFTIN